MEGQEFNPYDRVLVRDEEQERWQAAFYDQYITRNGKFPHHVIGGACFTQCIPYAGNEHLLGTTDSPGKPGQWKPKSDETFFAVLHNYGESFYVSEFGWDCSDKDERMYLLGNCFRTREEAEAMANKLNAILKGKE